LALASATLPRILAVDDDPVSLKLYRTVLQGPQAEVLTASTAAEAVSLLEKQPVNVLLLDLRLPDSEGVDVLRQCRDRWPQMPVIVMTGYGSIETAVECLKAGAANFLSKPVDTRRLRGLVQDALDVENARRQARTPGGMRLIAPDPHRSLVALSPQMLQILSVVDLIKDNRSNVFICGETGTGKELISRSVHFTGRHKDQPFVAVNCAGLAPSLVESELFGHTKGSFTGAHENKTGYFRAAQGGTLFLDEVTEIPPAIQAKLLRAIQEKRVTPVGATAEVEADVRVIAATNREPVEALRSGVLREDLFYRLNVVPIVLPPLRERIADIIGLVAYFWTRFSQEYEQPDRELSSQALAVLQRYSWPGNVRELENVIERIFAATRGDLVTPDMLPTQLFTSPDTPAVPGKTAGQAIPTLEEAERTLIEQALQLTGGVKTRAADLLKIDRDRLARKIKKYSLQ
jgi:DNA-binding NtrC family response regulator